MLHGFGPNLLQTHLLCSTAFMSKASNIMTVKVLPDHFANEAQEIWLPACFAIPWLLGQQVRHNTQLRQTKENGYHMKSKKFS